MHIISLFYLNMTWWIMFLFLVLCLLVWGCGNQSITQHCVRFLFLLMKWHVVGQDSFDSTANYLSTQRTLLLCERQDCVRFVCLSFVIRGFIVQLVCRIDRWTFIGNSFQLFLFKKTEIKKQPPPTTFINCIR